MPFARYGDALRGGRPLCPADLGCGRGHSPGLTRAVLAPGGGVLVADERVADEFRAPGDPIERMVFGWSVTHCLPASREYQPSEALGTVLRAGVLSHLARRAGFGAARVIDGGNDFPRLYWLTP